MFIEKGNEDGGYPWRIGQGSDLKIAQEKFPILRYLLRADVGSMGTDCWKGTKAARQTWTDICPSALPGTEEAPTEGDEGDELSPEAGKHPCPPVPLKNAELRRHRFSLGNTEQPPAHTSG